MTLGGITGTGRLNIIILEIQCLGIFCYFFPKVLQIRKVCLSKDQGDRSFEMFSKARSILLRIWSAVCLSFEDKNSISIYLLG